MVLICLAFPVISIYSIRSTYLQYIININNMFIKSIRQYFLFFFPGRICITNENKTTIQIKILICRERRNMFRLYFCWWLRIVLAFMILIFSIIVFLWLPVTNPIFLLSLLGTFVKIFIIQKGIFLGLLYFTGMCRNQPNLYLFCAISIQYN